MAEIMINAVRASQYRQAGQWTDDTLADRWDKSAAAHGEREFISDSRGRRYTYREMDEYSDRVAALLYELGIRAADTVTYQITPRCEFAAVTLACLKLGAVAVPLGLCFEGKELTDLLVLLDSRLHFSVSAYRGRSRAAMLEQAAPALPLLRQVVLVDKADSPFPDLDTLLAGQTLRPAPRHRGSGDDLAVILCTSGTTCACKAVMFTHNNIIFSEDGFNKALGLTCEDAMFMPAPLNHATGFHHGLIAPMLCGGRLVLQEKFRCAEALRQMEREGCTYSMGATPFIYDLLSQMDETGEKLPSLRFYICGGAPVPEALVRRAYDRHHILVCECYGSTESVPHLFVRPEQALEVRGRWSGQAMEGVEVRIVDENRRTVPPGVVGEEASRGPNVFVGYLKNPETTRAVLDEDGWYYSGDLCVMDEEGHVKVVGRKKDILIRGGENLNINELNDNLEGCPGVVDHAVVGMPDPRLGERICAFVVCRPCQPPVNKEMLLDYLASRNIHKRHWPERVEVIDEIPRTESGKVKKHLLVREVCRRMGLPQPETGGNI